MRASQDIKMTVAFRGNITAAEYARILKVRKANEGPRPIAQMQGEMKC